MKKSLILLIVNIFFISHLFGDMNRLQVKVNPLMKCLGDEEKKLYQNKDQGPLYYLNKELIGLFVLFSDVELKENYFNEVCSNKHQSTSHELLKLLLVKQEKIFITPKTVLNATEAGNRESFFIDMEQQIPQIFIKYISMTQGKMKHPHCLEDEIPELKSFLNKVKYLEGTVSLELIISENNIIDKIFDKLRNLPEIALKCKARFIEEEKAKLKDKTIGQD